MAASTSTREFDIILWGVTGFTGRLVATTFARRYGLRNSFIRIALAGRTLSRLEDVAQLMLREALDSNDQMVKEEAKKVRADADKGESILPLIEIKNIHEGAKSLCERTHVIIALAGPYIEFGEPIVKAAAECGTDYVDITGELVWVKSMKEKYDSIAKANRSRIIPCCGFDFLLNDVGIFCVQDFARQRSNCITPVQKIDQLYLAEGSRLSGGTIRTMLKMFRSVPFSRMVWGNLSDPFEFCDDQEISSDIRKKNSDIRYSRFSTIANRWMAPSIMTPMMKKYIHWTNEVNGYSYGRDFIFRVGEKADGICSALFKSLFFIWSVLTLVFFSRVGWLARLLTPASGEGRPTSELVTRDHFVQYQTVGMIKQVDSESIKVDYTITFDNGEAYMMTAWGALESGMACLKTRRGDFPSTNQYGVGFPSQLLGHSIVDQLKLAGFNFDLKETPLKGPGN